MRKIVSFRLVLLDKHRIINYGSLAKLKNYVMKHNVTNYKIFKIETTMFEIDKKLLDNI